LYSARAEAFSGAEDYFTLVKTNLLDTTDKLTTGKLPLPNGDTEILAAGTPPEKYDFNKDTQKITNNYSRQH
jgi:hypothetical protein